MNESYEEYEIDLRELFYTLWKRKALIIGLFIVGVLIAGIYSFIIVEPVYQTKAVLLAPDFELLNEERLSKNEYLSFLEKERVLDKVISENNLDIKKTSLIENLAINQNEKSNKVTLSFKQTKPQLAENVLTSWVNYFENDVISYISKRNDNYLLKIENKVSQKYNNYQDILDENTQFNKKNNLKLLNSRLNSKENRLVSLESDITKKENKLESKKEQYEILQSQLNKTDQKITLQDTFDNNSLDKLGLFSLENNILGLITTLNEEVNPVHTTLTENKNKLEQELQSLRTDIKSCRQDVLKLEEEIKTLQDTISKKEHTKTLLDKELNIDENDYTSLQETYSELTNTLTGKDYAITIVNEPSLPQNPVSPNVKLNLAIAGVLSLMMGVFLVFLLEFFKGTDWKDFENDLSN